MVETLTQSATEERINISARAAEEIRSLKTKNGIPEAHGLRLGIKGGGCSGFTYVLAFDEISREGDLVFEKQGVILFVDPRSMMHLSGTELDFSDGLNGRGFVFNNPNAARTCGCGSSFGV